MTYHPSFQAALLQNLPPDAKVLSVEGTSRGITAVTVRLNEAEILIEIAKANIVQYVNKQKVEVTAKEGEYWDDVIARFSDKYNLWLKEGIDFASTDKQVEFDETGIIEQELVLLDTSVLLFGSIPFTVKCETDRPRVIVIGGSDLGMTRLRLALSSRVCFLDHVPSLGLLTACQALEMTEGVGLDFIDAEVVNNFNDGLTDISVVKTKDNLLWFVRYKLMVGS